MLSEEMSMSKTVCHEILTKDLGKRKLNARLVTRSPNEEQKEDRSEICADLWKLQARMTYSAVPSSLKMKHSAYSAPRKKKKTKCRPARYKLTCPEENVYPAFENK